MRRKTLAMAAGGVLAASAISGVAIAAPSFSSTPEQSTESSTTAPREPDASTSSPSERGTTERGATDEDHLAKRTSGIAESLAGLVEDGTITQEQADAVAETLAESHPGRGGPGGHGGGPDGRGDGPGEHGGGPGGMGDALRFGLDTAAETLNLSSDELREQLQGGSSLADIAEKQGVERDALVDALVTAATEKLNERVDEGDLTQERADGILSDLEERIGEAVDRDGSQRPERGQRERPGSGSSSGKSSSQDDA